MMDVSCLYFCWNRSELVSSSSVRPWCNWQPQYLVTVIQSSRIWKHWNTIQSQWWLFLIHIRDSGVRRNCILFDSRYQFIKSVLRWIFDRSVVYGLVHMCWKLLDDISWPTMFPKSGRVVTVRTYLCHSTFPQEVWTVKDVWIYLVQLRGLN